MPSECSMWNTGFRGFFRASRPGASPRQDPPEMPNDARKGFVASYDPHGLVASRTSSAAHLDAKRPLLNAQGGKT